MTRRLRRPAPSAVKAPGIEPHSPVPNTRWPRRCANTPGSGQHLQGGADMHDRRNQATRVSNQWTPSQALTKWIWRNRDLLRGILALEALGAEANDVLDAALELPS